jgi:uncharacterized protein (DUF433 family)
VGWRAIGARPPRQRCEQLRVRSPVFLIEGTRVPVDVVLGKLAAGMTTEAVAEEYGLTRDDVLAALAYAAHTVALEEVRAVS